MSLREPLGEPLAEREAVLVADPPVGETDMDSDGDQLMVALPDCVDEPVAVDELVLDTVAVPDRLADRDSEPLVVPVGGPAVGDELADTDTLLDTGGEGLDEGDSVKLPDML